MSKQLYFKQLQFSLSTQFSSFLPIGRTLSGATTPSQSGTGSDGNEGGAPHSLKLQRYWNLTIRFFSVISRTHVGLTLLQRCSLCILQPQPIEQIHSLICIHWNEIISIDESMMISWFNGISIRLGLFYA